MKVQLTKGQANVGVKHFKVPTGDLLGHLQEMFPEGRRGTKVFIVLPSGEELTGESLCDSDDQFTKRLGKKYAFINLFNEDKKQAYFLGGGLVKSVKLSREDRRIIFQKFCPEFFSNTPSRRAVREKSMLQKLLTKYGLPASDNRKSMLSRMSLSAGEALKALQKH